jgi:hypothetical protein
MSALHCMLSLFLLAAWGGTLDIIMTTNTSSFHFFSAALLFFFGCRRPPPFLGPLYSQSSAFSHCKKLAGRKGVLFGAHSTVRLPVAGRARAPRRRALFSVDTSRGPGVDGPSVAACV